jgi:hypothetical protein
VKIGDKMPFAKELQLLREVMIVFLFWAIIYEPEGLLFYRFKINSLCLI